MPGTLASQMGATAAMVYPWLWVVGAALTAVSLYFIVRLVTTHRP